MLINKDKNDIYYIDRKVEWEKIEQLFWHLIYTPLFSIIHIPWAKFNVISQPLSTGAIYTITVFINLHVYSFRIKKKNLMFSNREMNKHWFQNWLLNTFLYPKLIRAMVDKSQADLNVIIFNFNRREIMQSKIKNVFHT